MQSANDNLSAAEETALVVGAQERTFAAKLLIERDAATTKEIHAYTKHALGFVKPLEELQPEAYAKVIATYHAGLSRYADEVKDVPESLNEAFLEQVKQSIDGAIAISKRGPRAL